MAADKEHSPFELPEVYLSKYLGFETASPERGRTEVTFEVQPQHINIVGLVHGGLYMTVLDSLMGHAAWTCLEDPRIPIATSSMTTHFLESVHAGSLTGVGRVVAELGNYMLAEAELRDEGGRLIATAEAIFTRIRPQGRKETP